MISKKMKNVNGNHGFTIVELLVVIVVIGILAAITIVSYTGITARANTVKAQSNAGTAQNVAEVYASELNKYPRVTTNFAVSATAKLPSGICMVSVGGTGQGCTANQASLTSANGATTVWYQYCGTLTGPAIGFETGGRIRYWDFGTNAISLNIVYVGVGQLTIGVAPCFDWNTPLT